jgi:hypothetical protein
VSFDDSGVPEQGESGDDRVTVSVDARRERVEAGKVVLPDGVEPLREAFALVLGEHVGEGPNVTGQSIEFRAVGQDGLESELFGLGQCLGSAENPSRHHAGRRRLCGDRPRRSALLSQVGADPAASWTPPSTSSVPSGGTNGAVSKEDGGFVTRSPAAGSFATGGITNAIRMQP